jgi:hypothetical protein
MENNDLIFKPLLPRLNEGQGNKIENFPKKGIWHSRPSVELEKLSMSLFTEKVEFEVNSIPDMWGRPILFEMALLDPAHPIHNRILGEWRGMLALLALRKLRRFGDLKVQDLKISGDDEKGEKPHFLVALSKVIPQKKFAEDSSWNHLDIILFKGRPIGITSPITLVCTSTHYYNMIDGVSWYNGKFLEDPKPHLNSTEKEALAGWVKKLKSSLLDHPDINRDMPEFNRMLALFDEFIADLGGVQKDIALSTDTLGMKPGIFKYLDKPVLMAEEVVDQSHVRLVSSKEPAPKDSLLVVDKEIAKQWKTPEKDIFVYRSIPLDRISTGTLVGDNHTLLDTPLGDARWCKPAEFFTEKLILIKQKNAFPGTIQVEGSEELFFQEVPVTPIIPLTNLILTYLNTDDIANRLRLEQLEDEIKVSLSLPLTGQDGRGKDFVISKTYRAKEEEIETLMGVPILEIWPNFISSHWDTYYTYFSTTGEKTFYAAPLNSSENKRSFPPEKVQVEREINRLNNFPETFECKTYRIDPTNKKPVPLETGILLIQKPESQQFLEQQYKVGVDFGTSSTNVYTQHGDVNPERMVFNERFFKVTDSPTMRRTELNEYFLPGLKRNTPFLSIFHDFMLRQKDLRPLLDGHIYFFLSHKDFNAAGDDMRTDLKWGDKVERTRAKTFLEQLCLQCGAEAAAKGASEISWRFSYPTAFSSEDEETFISMWDLIVKGNQKQTGIKPAEEKPVYKSESIASASYFANDPSTKAPITEGVVFIDIGGKTSDISIWQGPNKLLAQTSLRFAGRDIFSYPLSKKTNFLKDFCDEDEMKTLTNKKVQNSKSAFYAQLDAVVNAQGENMLKRLPNLGDETDVKEFKQLIAIGISGLLYYIGLLIRNLTDTKIYKKKMPNIYIGGNGSRLLHWLAAGNFDASSAVNKLFRAVFRKAYGIPGKSDLNIRISPDPKAEVAYGLVKDDTPLEYDREKVREGYFLAGEAYKLKGKKVQWNTLISPPELKSGITIPSKLEQLETFMDTFNENAKAGGLLPPGTNSHLLEETREQVNQTLSNLAGTDENEIRVEPLFMIALNELLKVKVDKWAKTK